jgi:hypothetical protein
MIENPVGRKIHWPRIAKIFSLKADISNEEPHMRITRLIFVGSIGVLAALMAPALAKNASLNSHASANAQKPDEQPTAQGCHAYQQAADGSWVQLSCQEAGPTAQAPARGRSATRIPDPETR